MNASMPTVSTGALPASRKVHISGAVFPDLRVPIREISLHPTAAEPPLLVYDSSGPYTDAAAEMDIACGAPRLRAPWIAARNDTKSSVRRPPEPEFSDAGTPPFPISPGP